MVDANGLEVKVIRLISPRLSQPIKVKEAQAQFLALERRWHETDTPLSLAFESQYHEWQIAFSPSNGCIDDELTHQWIVHQNYLPCMSFIILFENLWVVRISETEPLCSIPCSIW